VIFNLKWGYYRGYADGITISRQEVLAEWERSIAVLREELQDVRRDRDLQMARADAAADLLLQHLGTRAISLAGQQQEVAAFERKVKNVQTITALPDPTEEIPYGHPNGTYKDEKEASLFG